LEPEHKRRMLSVVVARRSQFLRPLCGRFLFGWLDPVSRGNPFDRSGASEPELSTNHMQKIKSQWRSPKVGLAFATALLIGTSLGSAQDQNVTGTNAPPPKNPWETTGAVGFTLTKGNSDTLLLTLSLDTKRKWERNEVGFGVAGGYGENDNVKNAEFVTAFGQYNRLITDRFYAGLRADFNYDGIANLDYRVTITPLAGYYLIKSTNTTLAFEVGPSAVFEKYVDQSQNTYLGIRFAERFEQKLSATTKFWESLSYVPQVDKWTDNYVITGEAGIDAAITKKWSLRVVFQDIYTSVPANGRKPNDIRLIAGTAYKF
jgi:putative salt-induced outer membrane protein YdiY